MGEKWESIMQIPYPQFERIIKVKDELEGKKRKELKQQIRERQSKSDLNEAKNKQTSRNSAFRERENNRQIKNN